MSLWHAQLRPWNNDPIPFWHQGVWHLFLQHNPAGPEFGEMCWGHVSSPDLVHWTTHAIALEPEEPYDARGVWTGSVIEHEGRFYAFYTSIAGFNPIRQSQSLATSDDLVHWQRHPANPLIPSPPPGYGECWRDPQVFRHGSEWLMIVGSQTPRGGAVLLYASDDLIRWRYEGPLWEAEGMEVGMDCECPDFFPLGDRWMLLSSRGSVHWQLGSFDGRRFTPETRGVADGDYNNTPDFSAFYAAKTAVDGAGRRLLFGWATRVAGDGWRGMIATPRQVLPGPRFVLPAELESVFTGQDGPLIEQIDEQGHWHTR